MRRAGLSPELTDRDVIRHWRVFLPVSPERVRHCDRSWTSKAIEA